MITLTDQTCIALALALPLLGAVLISMCGRHRNLREAVTMITALALLVVVMKLLPSILAGSRPSLNLIEIMPGIEMKFVVEPLGMIFAGLAAILWPINSVYSVGYMRGNKAAHQTRFYICFAIAIASAMGIALAGNLITLFIFL